MHGIRELSEQWRGQDRDDDKVKNKQSMIKIKTKDNKYIDNQRR